MCYAEIGGVTMKKLVLILMICALLTSNASRIPRIVNINTGVLIPIE